MLTFASRKCHHRKPILNYPTTATSSDAASGRIPIWWTGTVVVEGADGGIRVFGDGMGNG